MVRFGKVIVFLLPMYGSPYLFTSSLCVQKKRIACTMRFDLILLYHGGLWTFKDIFAAGHKNTAVPVGTTVL